ncbi:MAG: choice-of-anchor D domain-containing protein [Thermodesulfovibrionales bacterium]|nr:choice-of-anchor D domain-containing protein [Thermodesulfovibrionales bacterium]
MNKKYNNKSIKILVTIMLFVALIFLKINIQTAYAYNAGSSPSANEVHQWITVKAIDYLLSRQDNISWMYREILYTYRDSVLEGIWRADHTGSTICKWDAELLGHEWHEAFDCDTLHHYFQTGPIETGLFGYEWVNIAYSGNLTAQQYAAGLFDTARRFWPGGSVPILGALEYVNAGATLCPDIPLLECSTTGSLMGTYKGGMPQCQRYYSDYLRSIYTTKPHPDDILYCLNYSCGINISDCYGGFYCGFTEGDLKDLGCYSGFMNCLKQKAQGRANLEALNYCPTWPVRYNNQRISGDENVSDALFYLGWILHLIQDLTVPYHISNDATADHRSWEDSISNAIKNPSNYDFIHLPLLPGASYRHSTRTAVGDFYGRISEPMSSIALEIGSLTSTFASSMSGNGLKEILLDTAIKSSAALIEKYFREITPLDDAFENNDSRPAAGWLSLRKFNILGGGYVYKGDYSSLTLYPGDPDCYSIRLPENFMDLLIDLYFVKITGNEGVWLNFYKGETSLQGYSLRSIPGGIHVEAKELTEDDYTFCIGSQKNYPFNYSLQITAIPNIYLQNNPKIYVIPNTINLTSANDKRELTIYNRGGTALYVYGLTTGLDLEGKGPVFVIDFNYGSEPCGNIPITIPSLNACTVGVAVNAEFLKIIAVNYHDNLIIDSNDEDLNIELGLVYGPLIGDFGTIYAPFFRPDLPYIFIPETRIDFGDILVGGEITLGINIFNTGGKDLTINRVYLQGVSKSEPEYFHYNFYSQNNKDPLSVQPGGVVTVYITFNPNELGSHSANLIIESNDPEQPQIIITLAGRGFELIPGDFDRDMDVDRDDMNILISFFDESVKNGALTGSGPGKSAGNRLKALRNMLVKSGQLIEAGDISGACAQFMDAYRRTDGQPVPPDFVTGQAAPNLSKMIQRIMEGLCK